MNRGIHEDGELNRLMDQVFERLSSLFEEAGQVATLDRRARVMGHILNDMMLAREMKKAGRREPLTVGCPDCGCDEAKRKQRRSRTVITILGSVTYLRSEYRCPDCGATIVPLDRKLGVAKGSETSFALREVIALFYADSTTTVAVDHLRAALGFAMAPSTLHRAARIEGARADAKLAAEAQVAGLPATMRRIEDAMNAPALLGAPVAPTLRQHPTAIIEIDGCMLHEREAGWSETKLAVVSDLGARVMKPPSAAEKLKAKAEGRSPRGREILTRMSYVADARSLEGFRDHLWAEALRWRVPWAACLVVVGDGAPWIWNTIADLFAPLGLLITEVIDWRHAKSHLRAAATARYPNETAATAFVNRWLSRLWEHGDAKPLSRALRRAANQATSAEARDTLLREAKYFSRHAARMDYPTFRAKGYPVGSGAVDSACGTVCQDRCKRSGMWWSESGLASCLGLRQFRLNDRWSDLYPEAA